MAGYTPGPGPYDAAEESIENYLERLDSWINLNGIADDKKKHALLSEIGPGPYAILKDLAFPDPVTGKTYAQLQAFLTNHYKPKKTAMAERLDLHARKQRPGESIQAYTAALKKIAANCSYGAALEERLRDTFTFGIANPRIQKRLLEESQKDNYTWTSATTLALNLETVDKDSGFLAVGEEKTAGSNAGNVNRLGYHGAPRGRGQSTQPNRRQQYQQQNRPGNPSGSSKCFRCGASGHHPDDCKFKAQECFKCGKHGHTQSQCPKNSSQNVGRGRGRGQGFRSRGRGRGQSVRYVADERSAAQGEFGEGSGPDYTDAFLNLYQVTSPDTKTLPAEYKEVLHVNQKPMTFVIDTACPVTVIPEEVYRAHFQAQQLHEANLQLTSYTQQPVPVLGYLQVTVDYDGSTYTLPLYVTQGDNVALLGREWLQKIKLNWHRISAIQTDGFEQIVKEYPDVFSHELGTIRDFKAKIELKPDAVPKFHRPRPVPYALKDAVSRELRQLEERGVITRIERSDWAAPIVVVPKSDKSLRICGDYKVTINAALQQDVYPLPTAEDLFATLSGGELFTKLDLSNAYQQLELTPDSVPYLVINTHEGLFAYRRLTYGVSTAPNVFQQVMDQILQGIPGVTCYLDDILVASSREHHRARVVEVLERLRKYGVKLKQTKCAYSLDRVTYLGHEVSAKGVQPTQEKVRAIIQMRAPTDVHDLRVLMGMVNYYAKFLPDLSTLLAPWYELLRKDSEFVWSKACQRAFDQVKQLLASDKILVHYDPKKPLRIACDASPVGVGVVLSHVINGQDKPVAYASRSLTPAERQYCQLEREGLAVIYGLVKFHKFVFGRKVTIITDNQPLARILGPKKGIPSLAAARLRRWALILMAHNYDLQCRPSKKHANVDGLSRFPLNDSNFASELSVNYTSLTNDLPVTAQQIAQATRTDPVIAKALQMTMSGWSSHCPNPQLQPYYNRRDQLSVDQGCLLWGARVVIPARFRNKILQELHSTHLGIVKSKSLARSYFWWPGLDCDIENMVNACGPCQAVQKKPAAVPLIPWSLAERCWQRIHLDFAELNKKYLLIVVDAYSKWLEVVEMPNITATHTIKELRRLFASHGLPEVVVSDNGPQLVSEEMKNFLRRNGIRHTLSPPYHPATNGAAERNVGTVKLALKKHLLSFAQSDINRALYDFLLTYRVTAHATTGRSPAELFLKRQLRTRLDLLRPDVAADMQKSQEAQMRSQAGTRDPPLFQEGEIVRVQNTHSGLATFVKGLVLKVLGPYRYCVKVGSRSRDVHVDHLRKTGEMDLPEEESEVYVTSPRFGPTPVDTLGISVPVVPRQADPTDDALTVVNSPVSSPDVMVTSPRRSSRVSKPPDRLIESI